MKEVIYNGVDKGFYSVEIFKEFSTKRLRGIENFDEQFNCEGVDYINTTIFHGVVLRYEMAQNNGWGMARVTLVGDSSEEMDKFKKIILEAEEEFKPRIF